MPAVVLVSDRGPGDRDGTVYATTIFAIQRGSPRGELPYSATSHESPEYSRKMGESTFTIDEEIVHDAVAAIALLRTQPEMDGKRIYVAGLGVGGFIAPRIAADDGRLAGLIMMSAPARPLEDWYVETVQSLGVTGQQLDARKLAAAKVKKLDPGDADSPALFGLSAPYW